MENRTEFIYSKKDLSINSGLDLRYQRTKAYDDYFFEPVNAWDLTKDHSYINVYNSIAYASGHGFRIPGWPNRYAQPGLFNGDTNDSRSTTVGPFVQGTWKVNEQFNVVGGLRYDYFKAEVRERLLPPYPEADISVKLPNVNGSVIYKAPANSSVYFTYNFSKNTSGAVGNSGGITGWNAASTGLDKESFQQPSTLYELGTKYSLMYNKVFLNFAVYKGFESELNYQPNKHLYA